MVEMLIDHGADVNFEGGEHKHALCAALRSKDLMTMKLLYDNGARLHRSLLDKVLTNAISRVNQQALKFLLEYTNLRVNHRIIGGSIVEVICLKKQVKLFRYIFERYADQLETPTSMSTFYSMAARDGECSVRVM